MTAIALTKNWRRAIVAGAAVLLLLAVCIGAKIWLASGIAWRCPVLSVLAVPCPSCGSTRAMAALSEFRLWSALSFNPLLVLGIPAGVLAFGFRDRLARWPWAWPAFLGAVFLNWVYLVMFLPR